ncbi:class I SAM-dependent methyltransferase [Ideonella livida]|uniref:Class I SAM-dependent methyltransferase n=1 Tax=Ideonella livida TaxID=2707176 RepID=A0A7C9PI02_9BURK|nr:class I SAM-dependent methyltransferase [Ideonella livida]NDY91534.1 class I SAM-dependent methyltransferase [Ideonella livida]
MDGPSPLITRLWPLPALLVWGLAWGVFLQAWRSGLPGWLCLVSGTLTGLLGSLLGANRWRRLLIAAGFPLGVLLAALAPAVPVAAWLLPVVVLLAVYPPRAWRDAPLFPTPRGALQELAKAVPLAPGAQVLDAGCGLGAGLRALRASYPQARLEGWEWSWPLALGCRLRHPGLRVRRRDIWAASWRGQDLVYLFQRPESMPRAMDKARRELARGAWLVSLEFECLGWRPQARLETVTGKPVWVYQAPFEPAPAPGEPPPG